MSKIRVYRRCLDKMFPDVTCFVRRELQESPWQAWLRKDGGDPGAPVSERFIERYTAAKNNAQTTCFIGHFQASKTLSHPANIRALAAPGRRVQPSRHSRDRASNPFPTFDDQPAAEVVSSGPGTH